MSKTKIIEGPYTVVLKVTHSVDVTIEGPDGLSMTWKRRLASFDTHAEAVEHRDALLVREGQHAVQRRRATRRQLQTPYPALSE